MSSSKTLQSGVRPSQAIKDPKRRTGLLKDNSWIKRDVVEDDPVDEDPNYGRDVLKSRTSNGSKAVTTTPTSPAPTTPSANSLTKSIASPSKNFPTSPTVATSPTSTAPNKPPVPAKNPTLTTGSKSFTARVFSGASTNEKTFSPVKKPVEEKPAVLNEPPKEITNGLVKKSVDEKPPVSKEPLKEVTNGKTSVPLSPVQIIKPASSPLIKSESKTPLPQSTTVTSTSIKSESKTPLPQSTTVTSTSQASATFTSPEKTQPPTATKTEPSKSYEQSNGKTGPNTTTTVTTTSPQTDVSSVKAPSKALDNLYDTLIPTVSPTVQSNPVSPKPQTTTLSYSSSQLSNTPSTTVRSEVIQTPTVLKTVQAPPVKSPPSTQMPTNRIVGKRDLCSYCGKNITGGDRMILDDLQIFSHSSCFKCELCYRSLGSLEAGATLWVHRDKVNCENCYKKTKDKWFI